MRIMIIGASNSNHTKRWANAMSERGHDVLLVCRPDQKDDMGDLSPQVKTRCLKYGGQTYSYFLNVPVMKKIYKEFKPDIVNAHYASGYGLLARLSGVKPLVISVWGSDVFEYPNRNAFCHYILKKNLNYADAIASTSNSMADEVRRVLGNPDKKVTVTPFGVNVKEFCPVKEKKQNEHPVIGIVKYLEPIYDIPLLITAFSMLYQKSEIKPTLKIYGGGHLLDELKQLTVDLGIEQAVTFYGTIPNKDVPSVLNTFDIFVNCSKQESFGVAIVEAMACMLPVIATDTPGFSEVVDDGKTGYILKDRKPETMAEALSKLLADKELCKKFGFNGRNKVLAEYDWSKNVDTMETLYEKLIEKRSFGYRSNNEN